MNRNETMNEEEKTDDEREALEADLSVPMPNTQLRVWGRLIEFSQAYRAEHGFPPNEAARTRFLFAAFEVRPRGTVTEALAKGWDEGFALATRNSPLHPHPMAGMNPYRNGRDAQ